jgi:hypothetical protein
MKKLIHTLILLTLSLSASARGGTPDTEADYIVPTTPEFVSFSRFKVTIVDRFEGPHTQKISYVFPEFLVGEENRVFTLNRIPGTENSWSGDELDAHCTLNGDDFSCNIYVKKNKNNDLITAAQALTHLQRLNLSDEQLKGFAGVINSFYSHEPAGFLSYDID